uniref:Uncharacterized protein n=1 Tax=Heliothis virescens TaxID=7102 RepID=A0A2A4JHZ4_HELVI
MLSVIRRATLRASTPVLSGVRGKAAYEGEGKTTVRVINQEYDAGLMIDSYATYGFKLNNGLTVLGPMAIFPRRACCPPSTPAPPSTSSTRRAGRWRRR